MFDEGWIRIEIILWADVYKMNKLPMCGDSGNTSTNLVAECRFWF